MTTAPPEAQVEPSSESTADPGAALPLSTPELIQLLAALDFDPIALAAHLDHQILDILAWYESPEVQDIITRYEAFEDRMLELRAKRSKRTAIDTLETVIKTAEELPERRRAATTLLRALTRPLLRPRTKEQQRQQDESLLDDAIRTASRAAARAPGSHVAEKPCHQRSAVDAPVDASVGRPTNPNPKLGQKPGRKAGQADEQASDPGERPVPAPDRQRVDGPAHDYTGPTVDSNAVKPSVRSGIEGTDHQNETDAPDPHLLL